MRKVCGMCGRAVTRTVVKRPVDGRNPLMYDIRYNHSSRKAERDHRVNEPCSKWEFEYACKVVESLVRPMAERILGRLT